MVIPDSFLYKSLLYLFLSSSQYFSTRKAERNGNNFDPATTEGIKNIQRVLVKLGYLSSDSVTGVYGPLTTEAVKKFQADNGIEQTGSVGPLTQAALGKK